ncbi:hypothetical protein [Streptomyces sp. NBC_01465]|uniref:hypothetical protein n=1 Tax=Streptomyces sp. NBC_01465 TaxID=2903878 RepID=UPI002E30D1CB|nr:hypothetical protein [Streptomyces sp. NBC_01465]
MRVLRIRIPTLEPSTMPHIRTSLTALLLAAAGSLGVAAPALAACPGPPSTLVLSNEDYDRFAQASPDEQRLIWDDAAYRSVWLDCLPPNHVEPNMWGSGYVCLPEGAVQ